MTPPSLAVQQATERALAVLDGLDPGEQLTVAARAAVAILAAVRPRFEATGKQGFDVLCSEALTCPDERSRRSGSRRPTEGAEEWHP